MGCGGLLLLLRVDAGVGRKVELEDPDGIWNSFHREFLLRKDVEIIAEAGCRSRCLGNRC